MRIAALVLAAVLLGCSSGSPAPAPEQRPPLDDPPDPGPVPTADGLDDTTRDELAARSIRITGTACGRLVDGSGFAVAPDLVATSAHVVVGAEGLQVVTVDGREVAATTVAWDGIDDLALLRVDDLDLDPFPLGGAEDGAVGVILGWTAAREPDPSPFRIDRPLTVRIEEVAGSERIERRSWLVAADIDFGDSGAPLVVPDGVVVGVAYATTRREAGVAYAVRANRLEAMLAGALSADVEVPDCR